MIYLRTIAKVGSMLIYICLCYWPISSYYLHSRLGLSHFAVICCPLVVNLNNSRQTKRGNQSNRNMGYFFSWKLSIQGLCFWRTEMTMDHGGLRTGRLSGRDHIGSWIADKFFFPHRLWFLLSNMGPIKSHLKKIRPLPYPYYATKYFENVLDIHVNLTPTHIK